MATSERNAACRSGIRRLSRNARHLRPDVASVGWPQRVPGSERARFHAEDAEKRNQSRPSGLRSQRDTWPLALVRWAVAVVAWVTVVRLPLLCARVPLLKSVVVLFTGTAGDLNCFPVRAGEGAALRPHGTAVPVLPSNEAEATVVVIDGDGVTR